MTRRPIIPWPYNLLAAAALALLLVGALVAALGVLAAWAGAGDDDPIAPLEDEQEGTDG